MDSDPIPGSKAPTMRDNPFLNFHRSAEAAGYPALLIVSMVSLTMVVVPVALLGLTRAGWVLAVALLSLVAAVAVLAGAVAAAFADGDEPAARPTSADGAADEIVPVAPLERRVPTTRQAGPDRKAA